MTNYKHGCCVDEACTEDTCMALPQGESCGTCIHVKRCTSIFGVDKKNTSCDFFPRKFRKNPEIV
jgi:hypothetical protein